MAAVKISALPAVATPDGADSLPVVQGGVTKKMTVAQINAVSRAIATVTGNASTLAAFDGSGNGTSLDNYTVNTDGGLNQQLVAVPISGGGFKTLHSEYTAFNPSVANADENWYHRFIEASVGDDDSGNQFGDNADGSLTAFGTNVRSIQSSSVGRLTSAYFGAVLGGGSAPVTAKSITGVNINLLLQDDSEVADVYAINFGVGQSATNSDITNNFAIQNFGGTIRSVGGTFQSANYGVSCLSANQVNGVNWSPQLTDVANSTIGFSDFMGQQTGGVFSGNYFSAAWQPSIRSIIGGYWGTNIAPTVDDCDYAYGLQINMDNVTSSGDVKAIEVKGDVDVDGDFAFTGTLGIGKLTAFTSDPIVDGGGTPTSVHTLISGLTAAASATIANADMIGVNTACLIDVGANANISSGPFGLGLAALALPAVVKIGNGATVGNVHGAVFALSLDATSGNGTFQQMAGCRATTVPQGGAQQITRLYGYHADLFAGDPGDDSWGIYVEDYDQNYLEAGLKIGGTAGTNDTTTHKLEVEGSSLFNGNIGFYNTTPIAQPASSGVATAGGAYGATEQTMLQEVYDAVRALGLMS